MSNPKPTRSDLPILPAIFTAVLCLGAAVHGNPEILRPLLTAAQALPHLL